MRYLFFLLFLQAAVAIHAQPVIPVFSTDDMVNLAPDVQYLEDPGGAMTLEQVLQPSAQQKFRRLGKRMVNFGLTNSAYWLRTDVQNASTDKILIEVGNNALTDLSVTECVNGRVVQQVHTGNWLRFNERLIKNVNYLFPLTIQKGEKATVYIRVVHTRGTQFRLKAGTLVAYYEVGTRRSILEGMYYGFMLLMVLYNLFLFFSLRDRAYLNYVFYIFFMALLNAAINGFAFRYLWPEYPLLNRYDDIIAALAGIAGILFAARFLNTKENAPFFHKVFMALLVVYVADILLILSGNFLIGVLVLELNSLLLVASFFMAAYQILRSGFGPARFFLIAWSFLLLSVFIFILSNFNVIPSTTFATHSIQIGSAVEALLLSMALANRINVYKEEKRKAQMAALHSLEKNKKLIIEQNMMLEKKVEERTTELKKANDELTLTLQNLKETQTQLVQKEKMASLGELTAGIAHEIQNPLNFVNNFSEVSTELVEEMKTEMMQGQANTAVHMADDLKENLERILYHGRRADSIVRGMLQHSRISEVVREKANLNTIVDESLRLAYYGLKAKDTSFTALTETHYDESIGEVELVPQEMGRVLLNLFNNALYSVKEKRKLLGGGYQPVVSVVTRKENSLITISIRDNGIGIPEKLLGKIYQPFFTTKPAGEGTGLGLSLCYDIVTKQHGGSLEVDTEEGQYAEFAIRLPVSATT